MTLSPNTVSSVALDNLFTDPDDNVTEVFVTSNPDHISATVTIVDNDELLVTAVYVNGTNWSELFRDLVDGTFDGSELGFEISDIGLATVPWINVDQIIVEFNSDIDAVSLDSFTLGGTPGFVGGVTPGVIPGITSVDVGPGGNTAVINLADFLQASEIDLQVNGAEISTNSGNAFSTNDNFTFLALPGDAVQENSSQFVVNSGDAQDVVNRQNSLVFLDGGGMPAEFLNYEFFADLDLSLIHI